LQQMCLSPQADAAFGPQSLHGAGLSLQPSAARSVPNMQTLSSTMAADRVIRFISRFLRELPNAANAVALGEGVAGKGIPNSVDVSASSAAFICKS
jgi:hypothetical protein